MSNELSDALYEIRGLKEIIKKMEISICVFCREELGNMNFESDEEAVKYMMSFFEDK